MGKCRWTYEVERWFDGETVETDAVARHVHKCRDCAAHLGRMREMRTGAAAVVRREEIRDPQLAAFLGGIRSRIEQPAPRRGVWAMASLIAASLIVALAAFLVLTNGLGPVAATVVESCSTDIQGATVTSYSSDNGVATVCLTVSQDDIW